MSEPAILVEGVAFDYPRGPRALDGIDLRVGVGERVVVVGQNGSGKSTLVRQFNGLLRPSAGSVSINGRPIGRRHVAELAHEIGLAFQNPDRQIFAGSVRAEVAFGPRNLGLSQPERDAAVERAIATAGLVGDEQTNPYDLGF
jgi:energy-coupling factor transporter ATP-binding protein EcfA2